jgi:hypothetical protein
MNFTDRILKSLLTSAGNPPAAFDERGVETGLRPTH